MHCLGENKYMKIIEWNIHQMADMKGINMITKLVIEELKEQVTGMIVLFESFYAV